MDLTPNIDILRLLRKLSFTPWFAIGEFVDNSISSALQNVTQLKRINGADYQLRVTVEFSAAGSLVVSDNAAGISLSDFDRALKTGQPPTEVDIGLGRFGFGMKAAAFWWGQVLRVETWPIDSNTGYQATVDLNEVTDKGNALINIDEIPRRNVPGTVITIENLWQERPKGRTIGKIKTFLPSIYRNFIDSAESPVHIQDLRVNLFFQGQQLRFVRPKLLTAPFWPSDKGPAPGAAPRLWRTEVDMILSTGQRIAGWVGILEVLNRDRNSGFFMHFKGRGVMGIAPADDDGSDEEVTGDGAYKPKRLFGQAGTHRNQSLVGEFDVSAFGKTITSDALPWSDKDEDEFVENMLEVLKQPGFDMWTMANCYRRRLDQKNRKQVEEDRRVSEKALADIAGAIKIVTENPQDDLQAERVPTKETITHTSSVVWTTNNGQEIVTQVIFTEDRSAPLLQVNQPVDGNPEIVINEAHPSLASMGDLSGQSRDVLTRLCTALAAAELLSTSFDRATIRSKFNEILNNAALGSGL